MFLFIDEWVPSVLVALRGENFHLHKHWSCNKSWYDALTTNINASTDKPTSLLKSLGWTPYQLIQIWLPIDSKFSFHLPSGIWCNRMSTPRSPLSSFHPCFHGYSQQQWVCSIQTCLRPFVHEIWQCLAIRSEIFRPSSIMSNGFPYR